MSRISKDVWAGMSFAAGASLVGAGASGWFGAWPTVAGWVAGSVIASVLGIGVGSAVRHVRRRQLPPPVLSTRTTPSDEELVRSSHVESLGILAGGIAHDFNNLLTGILGNTNLALADLPSGPIREAVVEADTAARRARELVAQILAYSGRGGLELRSLDLGNLVSEMVTLLQRVVSPQARLSVASEDSAVVEADPAQIRQVVMNLITNASDALGGVKGDIAIRIVSETIGREDLDRTLLGRELPPGRYVRLEVRDTGCGMDDETRIRMFEPYFTTKHTGRGLGLAALLGIVRHHRGTVRVDSSPGIGTTIVVWWPVAERVDARSDRSEQPRPSQSFPQRTGLVLLAEDEEMVRRVATRMLSKLGFDVIAVRNGREALRALDEDRGDLTLALVDVIMPEVDGREVLRQVRERNPHLPTVLMTGYAGPDTTPGGPMPDAWLRKPFSLRDLIEAIDVAGPNGSMSSGPAPPMERFDPATPTSPPGKRPPRPGDQAV